MAKTALNRFLEEHRVNKGCEFTHTSLDKPKGCFYIPPGAAFDEFMGLYTEAACQNEPLHMTEKHRDIGPIVIDLDFKQTDIERKYTNEHIKSILYEIMKVVDEYIKINRSIPIYIMEKPPRKHNKAFKDGMHIVIPDIVTRPKFQYFLRNAVMDNITIILHDCGYQNSASDIYDKSVIETNNWMMYGSNKPDEGPNKWQVTHIYEWDPTSGLEEMQFDPDPELYVETLSIRNKYVESEFKLEVPELMPQESVKAPSERPSSVAISTFSISTSVDYAFITELVNILSEKRSNNYQEWIRVGWCLHNINASETMLELWKTFSKRSYMYSEGECEREWMRMRNEGLNIGSLCRWAKEDNPQAFKEICQQSIPRLISQSSSGTHTDIARVLYRLYMDRYVCGSMKKGMWYEFVGHRWVSIENAYTLKLNMSDEVSDMYKERSDWYKMQAMRECEDNKREEHMQMHKRLWNLSQKLRMQTLKEPLVKECSELFYMPGFMNKLDQNKKLLGFNNGVYDLETHEFRDGKPADYVTMTVGYDYMTEDDPVIEREILDFMSSIMPNETLKEYLLKVCAYMLDGNKYLEQFWFFTGKGRNGKGTLSMLLRQALGEYYYEPDITIVTTLKKSSSGTNDELKRAKGKRAMVLTEPDDADKDSKFRVNKIKQMRGNDLLQARGMYEGFEEFVPQFGMIFQMNEMPQLSKLDDGIRHSLKVIQFPYQFVETPTQEYQRKSDTKLKRRFETDVRYWQQFMRLLIKVHRASVWGNMSLNAPQEVSAYTKEYLDSNNPLTEWFRSNYEVTNDERDRVKGEDMRYDSPISSVAEFSKYMGYLGFKTKVSNSVRYYHGIRKKMMMEQEDDIN